jgi:hypothetical protein
VTQHHPRHHTDHRRGQVQPSGRLYAHGLRDWAVSRWRTCKLNRSIDLTDLG